MSEKVATHTVFCAYRRSPVIVTRVALILAPLQKRSDSNSSLFAGQKGQITRNERCQTGSAVASPAEDDEL